jgi:hypothetical protein
MIGFSKGYNEKSIRLIFDKTSKEATVLIKKIEIIGYDDEKIKMNSVGCEQCPVGYFSRKDGSSSCEPCPAGMTSNSMRTECE